MAGSVTLRLRTKDNLLELLKAGQSGAWRVGKGRENYIDKVQIFSWDGSLALEASHDLAHSFRTEDNRLVVGLLATDARIVRYDPPFQWQGQNSVNYWNDTDADSTSDDEIQEPPPFAPDDSEEMSVAIAQMCEDIYGEPIRLVAWRVEQKANIVGIFREHRRGWYFEVKFTQRQEEWRSSHRVLPIFLPLLDPDEMLWAQLTTSAQARDWWALDSIIFTSSIVPGSILSLAGPDTIGEAVADDALERFGFYVPDEAMLPGLLFDNRQLKITLLSYFKHPNGFGTENLLVDHNTQQSAVFNSLKEADQALYQKLYYYIEES